MAATRSRYSARFLRVIDRARIDASAAVRTWQIVTVGTF